MYLKNTASQKLEVFAFDYTTGAPKTGDASNITAYVNIDEAGYNALGDTSATEVDSTNKKGLYLFDLTQGETNGTKLGFFAKSSTANVSVVCRPAVSFTQPTAGLASPTNITAGTITTVTNQLTAAQIATGVWQDATAGDFTAASSIGKSLYTSGVVPGASGGLFIAGTNAATTITTGLTTHLIGTVDTVTTVTNQLTAAQIATGVWTDTTAGDFTTALSVGKSIMNGVSLGTGLTVAAVSGAVGSVTSGVTVTTNNDKTGYTLTVTPPTAAAIATSVLTTQMTESYAADGTAPTLAQAIFLTMQHLSESSIVSTTLTVKKLDGSTSAATFTLNDATNPTSITRAS